MTNSDKAIREFCEKYMIGTPYTLMYKDGNPYYTIVENNFLSDLTALISEHYYPKEFVLWLIIQNYWGMDILTCKWTNDEPKAFQEEKTTDELFNYWEENER